MKDEGIYGESGSGSDGESGQPVTKPDVCPVTGGEHVTARLQTADGWLRCIECEQTLTIRAG